MIFMILIFFFLVMIWYKLLHLNKLILLFGYEFVMKVISQGDFPGDLHTKTMIFCNKNNSILNKIRCNRLSVNFKVE